MASAFIWAPRSELQTFHKCTTLLMCALLLFFYPGAPHAETAFEPLQMLVRARKSMHSNRDKSGLVLDNSGCLSVHYSLDRRETVTTAATAEVLETEHMKAKIYDSLNLRAEVLQFRMFRIVLLPLDRFWQCCTHETGGRARPFSASCADFSLHVIMAPVLYCMHRLHMLVITCFLIEFAVGVIVTVVNLM